MVLGTAGRPRARQGILPALPDAPVLPGRRDRTPRTARGLGRRDRHSWRDHHGEKGARPTASQAKSRGRPPSKLRRVIGVELLRALRRTRTRGRPRCRRLYGDQAQFPGRGDGLGREQHGVELALRDPGRGDPRRAVDRLVRGPPSHQRRRGNRHLRPGRRSGRTARAADQGTRPRAARDLGTPPRSRLTIARGRPPGRPRSKR